MAAMERNYEAVCFRCHLNFIQCTFINIVLDQLHQSVSDSKHSEPCRRVFIQTETQDAPALRWRHLAETTEKRKKKNPWTRPPIQMEMNPPRCVWCAQRWNRRRLRGVACLIILCLQGEGGSFRMPSTEGHQNWQEQTDNSTFHSWASIYPQTIDREAQLKNDDSHRHTKHSSVTTVTVL